MTGGYFNEYHLQFLKLFVERGVRFLIIGGQARAAHHGTRTRDLDVWVDISVANRPSIDNALFAWAAKYPTHSASNFSPPLQLRPNVQIKFPDAEVLFLGADGEPHEIGPEDCIDVLTSIGSADFVEHYPSTSNVGTTRTLDRWALATYAACLSQRGNGSGR